MFDVLTKFESPTDVAAAVVENNDDAKRNEVENSKIERRRRRTFQEGMEMPFIGFGTAALGIETKECVKKALEVGYRMIDTAQAPEWYREDLVGEALAESEIERKELFVTTKIHPRHLGRKGMDMIASSLKNLRTEYIDLVLLHYSECWGNLLTRGGRSGNVERGVWRTRKVSGGVQSRSVYWRFKFQHEQFGRVARVCKGATVGRANAF